MTTVMIFFPGGHAREEIQKQQAGPSPINLDFCFRVKDISKEWENWWSYRLLSGDGLTAF